MHEHILKGQFTQKICHSLLSLTSLQICMTLYDVTVWSAESLSSAIPLGTSTKRANSKRANHGQSRLFQDAASSVSFWLRSFPVCGWRTRSLSSVSGPPTRWRCVRGWLMRLLWAYEHDFAAISPFLYERIGTLCRHPCWSLWLEQRIAGWRSGRSEGYSAASGDGFTSSEDQGAVVLPPSGVVATAAPDPELTAMLARAAVSIGLEVNRPPSPEPSRLDDWFLGAGRGSQPRSTLVPFFPEVHEELTKSWMAPFTARSRSSASSILTTLDGGVARGYAGIPQVERAISVHLCPRNAAIWRNRPHLPSKACKLTAALAAKAYSAAGQAISALHAMAMLQDHQAKALKQMHEGSTDPGLMQELCTATDFALRATKVTARSLGKAMSTMVVQERHLWLNLAEMKDADKARFLDAPISQAGLFGDTVEGFAQQFSAVQLQTEAMRGLPRRDAPSTAAPGARPQSAHRRGRPPASSRAAPPQAESTHRPARRASRRRAAPPASQPGPKSSRKLTKWPWREQPGDVGVCSFSGDRGNSAAPSPRWRAGRKIFCFRRTETKWKRKQNEKKQSFCSEVVTTFSKKEQFPFPPGSQVHGMIVCDALPPHSRPRPILPVAKRVRFGDDIPPHAPLASPVWDPGSSVRMPQNALPSVPSTPTPFRCTTTGTSIVLLEPLAQRLEAWLTLPSLSRWLTRTIRLSYAIQFARRPPKFNGVLETSVADRNAPVLRD